jgi:tRNA threonylcarbamoyladenosine biosynthesis protein TsaB
MTLILALETSTPICGIALLSEQNGVISINKRQIEGVSGHAQSVLPLAAELLAELGRDKSELSCVAFGNGPGAFTGIRVACGVAQGIGLALDIPLIPVGSLYAVAAKAAAQHPGRLIIAALDARMDEVYLAAFLSDETGALSLVQQPVLLSAKDSSAFVMQRFLLWQRDLSESALQMMHKPCLTGEGWRVPESMAGLPVDWLTEDLNALPDAYWVAQLAWLAWKNGQTVLPEHAAPLYLRDKVAFTTAERATGQGGNPRATSAAGIALLPMRSTDIAEVLELERLVQSHPWTEKNFEDALEAGYEAWVLRAQAGLAGFCLAMIAPDVIHILVIAVDPDQQRRGLGQMLLKQVIDTAKQQGQEGLLLEVRPSNLRALAFYLSQGFVQIGIRRDYYPAGKVGREDALVLKKTFEPA